jgi:hypothetical protein
VYPKGWGMNKVKPATTRRSISSLISRAKRPMQRSRGNLRANRVVHCFRATP